MKNIIIKNKKASFKFIFLETEIAGIILKGTEIKSIKMGKAHFTDSFCYFKNNELWLKNFYISEYNKEHYQNHDPIRDKKLLLTKKQLLKFNAKVNEKGLTIVPIKLYINNKGIAKLEIALSKGKSIIDKRQIIKENDIKKEMDREIKKII
jgi:SsrA-binding protein